MKKICAFTVVLFFICVLLTSCSKQSINDEVSPHLNNIVNATIAPNQNYTITISEPGEVAIVKQAKHYKTSEIKFGEDGTQTTYSYSPAKDYVGTEEVILTNKKSNVLIYRGCNGGHTNNPANASYTTVYTMLRINISN